MCCNSLVLAAKEKPMVADMHILGMEYQGEELDKYFKECACSPVLV